MIKNGLLYEQMVGDYKIYFPHKSVNDPQKKFIDYMMKALKDKQNALI
jgi:hypothetical protein